MKKEGKATVNNDFEFLRINVSHQTRDPGSLKDFQGKSLKDYT